MSGDAKIDVPPAEFRLDEDEWLAVLPAAPEWFPDLPAASPPGDPAAAVRSERPLTLEALLAALRPQTGALAASVRLQVFVHPWSRRTFVRATWSFLGFIGLTAVVCVFGGGYYSVPQLAVGMAAFLVMGTACTFLVSIFSVYRSTFKTVGSASPSGMPQSSPEFSSHGAAGLARWIQLAARRPATAGSLLEHDPKDLLCPCSNASCAGTIPLRAGVARVAESAFKFGIYLLMTTFFLAGASIFPPMMLAIWATPWSAFMCAFFLAGTVAFGIPIAFGRFSTNLPLLQLSRRINRRAMRLALTPLVEWYRSAAFSGSWTGSENPQRAAYMDLHRIFASGWRNRIRSYNASSPLLIPVAAAVVAGCANMAAGACLPALYPAYLLYQLLATFLFDLVHVAAANAQIDDIRSLYFDAAQELADLRRELLACPSRADPALAAALDADVQVLTGYTGADRYRARFLGFVVTFGALRTLLVTAVTLAVGLWSVLRGLGVVLTGELPSLRRLPSFQHERRSVL
ncbi:hypothetical protein DFJ74DRAFT_666444 [Hyaloraphidium curvatum]|nr:hypothetical protein DFJ74DRAFT_666444 [Hyaloraphidium curvatum]